MSKPSLNFMLFSAVAAFIIVSVLTSCEREALTTEDISPTFKKQQPTPTLDEQGEKSYIIMFKADTKKQADNMTLVKSAKSREEGVEIAKKINEDFQKEIQQTTKNLNLKSSRIKHYYSPINGICMTLTDEELRKLQSNPLVESIEEDKKIEVEFPEVRTAKPDDAPPENTAKSFTDYYGWFNHHHNGYATGGASKNTWIWIIDTGIDMDHPDLNVVTNPTYTRTYVGGTPDDCNGHGTHVAGIAAAKANNYGIVGISEGAWVVPIRIMGCTGNYSNSTLVAALSHLYYVAQAGDVINMSIGGGGPVEASLRNTLNYINGRGIHMVMAAGNRSDHAGYYTPANYNNTLALTVASMDGNLAMSSFSNYGMAPVDYIAVGGDVYSTYMNGGFATLGGTSMATPVVSGILHARGYIQYISGYVNARGQYYPIPIL